MPVLSSAKGPRPLSRRQSRENNAFLKALRATGNARLAALILGVHRSTYTKRRVKHPAFAAAWDSALEEADAGLQTAPQARPSGAASRDLRTRGGESAIVRTASGRLQLRRSPPGRMTEEAQELFLDVLAETANVRLSAAAAGFARSSFFARRRMCSAFANEMDEVRAEAGAALAREHEERKHAPLDLPDFDDYWTGPDGDNPRPLVTIAQALYVLRRSKRRRREG